MSFILHLKHSTHLSKKDPETVYLAVSGAGTVSVFIVISFLIKKQKVCSEGEE